MKQRILISTHVTHFLALMTLGFSLAAIQGQAVMAQRLCGPYSNDVGGANDDVDQSDLTQYCSNFKEILNVPSLLTGASFDKTTPTGANTLDLGIYYDTDDDGFANYAVFVSITNNGTVIGSQQLYTCSDDNATAECKPAVLSPDPVSCKLTNPSATDPFPTGEDYPDDANVECSVPVSYFTVSAGAELQFLNACTLSSASITSAKKDCGAYEGGGFITVVKNALPINGAFSFEIKSTLTPQGGTNDYSPPPITTSGGTGTSGPISVPNSTQAGTFSVNEIIPAEWSLANFTCNAGTKGDTGYSGITIGSGTEVDCTFNNQLRYGSLEVTKVVDWNGYTPDTNLFPHSSFEVCIDDADDLADTPVCQDVVVTEDQGVWSGTTTFTDVLAGTYNVTETDPGANWAVTLPVAAIEVLPGQEAQATVANRLKTGTITLTKSLLPTSDAGKFDLFIKDGQDATVASKTDVGDAGTLGPVTVLIGSYSVSEAAGTGTDLANYKSYYACGTDNPAGGTSTTVSVADGDAISCAFTNKREASVTISKVTQRDTGTGFTDKTQFNFGGTYSFVLDTDAGTATPDSKSFAGLDPDLSFTFTETVPTDWSLYSIVCKEGETTVTDGITVNQNSLTVDPAPGQNLTCTFTNRRDTGTLAIKKICVPSVTDTWDYAVTGEEAYNVDDLACGATSTARNVITGSYAIAELGELAGYKTTITCQADGKDIAGFVDVMATSVDKLPVNKGENVVCTFTNAKYGSITIVKDDDRDSGDDFAFTGKGDNTFDEAFSLDDDSDGTLSNTSEKFVLLPGTYDFTETLPANGKWNLDKVVCTIPGDPDPVSFGGVTSISGGVSLALAGEDVTCTFFNKRKTGSLQVAKTCDPDYKLGEFDIAIGAGETAVQNEVLECGESGTIHTVDTGTYSVVETGAGGTVIADYTSSYACTVDGTPATSGSGTSLSALVEEGKKVVCTFTNNIKRSSITIAKSTLPTGDLTAFGFSDFDLGTFDLKDGEDKAFTNLVPNTYAFAESGIVAGSIKIGVSPDDYTWDLTAIECTDDQGSPVTVGITSSTNDGSLSVDLGPGQDVYCTFTDKRRPRVTLVKSVSNNDGGTLGVDDFGLQVGAESVKSGIPFTLADGSKVTVSEAVKAGYSFIGISGERCAVTDLTMTEDKLRLASSEFEVTYGDDVSCTIANDDVPVMLRVVKQVTDDLSDDPTPWTFEVKVAGSNVVNGASCAADNGNLKCAVTNTDPDFDVTLKANAAFSVTETADARYTTTYQLYNNVAKQVLSATSCASDGLDVGGDVTCTITNTRKAGYLKVVKDVVNVGNPDDPATFEFTVTGPTTPYASKPKLGDDDAISSNGTAGGSAVKVATGTYTISEVANTLYNTKITCVSTPKEGAPVTLVDNVSAVEASVTVAEDATVVCTFTNTRRTGTVTIVKNVNGCPDPAVCGPAMWTFTIQGYPALKTGDKIELPTGTYTIVESGPAGYVASASGACSIKDGQISLDVKEGTSTCTITNSPNLKIALKKEVNVKNPADEAFWYDANNNASAVPVTEDEPVWYRVCMTNTGDWPLSNLSLQDNPYQWAVDAQCKATWAATTIKPGEKACCIYQITAYTTRDKDNCDSADGTTCKNRAQGTGYYLGIKSVSNTENAFYEPLDRAGLPIEFSSVEATLVSKGTVRVAWETLTETNNAGFAIEMRRPEHTEFDDEVAFVEGAGTSTTPKTYEYTVSDLEPGPYAFRLRQVDLDGQTTFSPEVEVTVTIPDKYYLSDVYPNPFNPTANIRFGTQESVQTRIELYNVRGQMVKLLYEGTPSANAIQTIRITAEDLSSGVYIVRIAGPNFAGARKMVLFK